MEKQGNLAQWLTERCRKERLSLRQAGGKTGLSHSAVRDIMNGTQPLPETIKKLATGFGGNGTNQQIALEDHLLVLAGYRREGPERKETSMVRAALLDKVDKLTEAQVELMVHFADFLNEIERT